MIATVSNADENHARLFLIKVCAYSCRLYERI